MTTDERVAPAAEDPRRARLWAAGLAAALLAALLWWFGPTPWGGAWIRETSPAHDTIQISTIYERWGVQVADGRLPLWFPEFAGGTNVHAAWMFGLFYPPLLLFAVLPPDIAWTWLAILHIVFGALGVYAWSLDERRDTTAAACAAVVFALSGFVLGRMLAGHLNVLMPACWVPWTLRATLRTSRGERGAVAPLGLCAGLLMLAGHVQITFYAAALAAAYGLFEARRRRDPRAVLRLAGGGALALGVAAIQWVPAWELFALSGHPSEGAALVASSSASFSSLAAQFAPRFAERDPTFGHEHLGLAGPLAVAAALLAFRPRDAGRWFWIAVLLFGLLLATGPTNAVGAFLNDLPPFRFGRVPGRAFLIVVVAASVLAGHCVADWFGPGRGRSFVPAAFLASALAFGLPRPETVSADFRETDWLAPIAPADREHRLHPGRTGPMDSRVPYLELLGARSMRDLCPLDAPGYKALERAPQSVFAWWFDVAGLVEIPWTPTPDGAAETNEVAARGRFVRLAPGGALHTFDRAETAPDHDALERLKRGDRPLLLPPGEDASMSLPNAAPARLTRPAPDRLAIAFDESGGPFRGFVLVSEKWCPGWEPEREGVSLHRGNLAFLTVKVVGGKGPVELAYRPWWRIPALAVSAASALGAAAAFLLARRRA